VSGLPSVSPNFTDKVLYRGAAEPSIWSSDSPGGRSERNRVSSDHQRPDDVRASVDAGHSLVNTGEEMFEYACHEGNYGMEGILSGARAEERAKVSGK
jgi:hypothetical protein